MRSNTSSVKEYIDSADPGWKPLLEKLRDAIVSNLPEGFEETMTYGMIGYVVPHSIYPDGYHVNPEEPLPFINLAVQKNNISLYHMGIYGNSELEGWFHARYREEIGKKPDMGRSCIRFKKEEDVPFALLEELFSKISVDDYIKRYRERTKGRKRK